MEACLLIPSRVRWASSLTEHHVERSNDYLKSNDSAFCALTDFRREYPITVGAGRSIDDAFADMARLGVHALLVTQEDPGCADLHVLGLITAYDIERERPHRCPGSKPLRVATSIDVADIMTPWDELSLVNYESLFALTARDIYTMFQGTGLTHLLVVEIHSDDTGAARGLLSRTTLSKRLRNDQRSLSTNNA